MTKDPRSESGRVNPLLRLLDWLADLLPHPSDETQDDPMLIGIEDLSPEEQAARKHVWWDQFRRGRTGG
jgi:hypothetical protein